VSLHHYIFKARRSVVSFLALSISPNTTRHQLIAVGGAGDWSLGITNLAKSDRKIGSISLRSVPLWLLLRRVLLGQVLLFQRHRKVAMGD
jgi:hypothetical protein